MIKTSFDTQSISFFFHIAVSLPPPVHVVVGRAVVAATAVVTTVAAGITIPAAGAKIEN